MPSIDANRRLWNDDYTWTADGDEWSEHWGCAELQWHGSLLPRVRQFLPAARVVEIAPGRGRWTQFLLDACDHLTGVDLSPTCVQACRERFADHENAVFHETDGRHLTGVPDGTTDFVFSFDSLVHAELDVMEAYLREVARVLTPQGAAFLHHSNVWAHRRYYGPRRWIPFYSTVARTGLIDPHNWRGYTVSAERIAHAAERVGLRAIRQEIVPWNSRHLIDCMTTLVRRGASADTTPCRIENPLFEMEARSWGTVRALYGARPRTTP
jgi:ubiquinone/menaquinone biosynthesis C-methylase UbiE